MSVMWQGLRLFIWMTVLTGLLYPALITVVNRLAFKQKSEGSLITIDGRVVGSKFLAQKFSSDRYFWPRPSAIDYNPLPSGGSNLAPTSALLKKHVEERAAILAQSHGITNIASIPSSLLFASGSGLDPHLPIEAVYFQIDRVAKARNMDTIEGKRQIRVLVDSLVHHQIAKYINILMLNIELDNLKARQGITS